MPYKKSFASVFNPAWAIILQTVLAILLISGNKSFTWLYLIFISVPAIIYILYAVLWSRLSGAAHTLDSSPFNAWVWKTSVLLLLLVSVGNVLLVLQLVEFYGGLSSTVKNFGRTQFIIDVQYNAPKIVSYLIGLNYIVPVAIVPVILRKGVKTSLIILALPVLLLVVASNLYGARILFLDTFISFALTAALLYHVRLKLIIGSTFLCVLLIFSVAGLQAARYGDNITRGFEEVAKYYSVSLNHGAIIISQNRTGQPMYWTLRSTFSVPFLSDVIGTQIVYESIFGRIPIKSREDDFAYAARLGVDPRYNTFSIYGYSFLDLGLWGLLIVLFSYLFVHYVYSLYMRGMPFGILLYPSFYALLLDQLRTNSIFSTRAIYFLITTAILMAVHIISSNSMSRTSGKGIAMRKLR